MDFKDVPVFDRASVSTSILSRADEWNPAKTRIRLCGKPVAILDDGPTKAKRKAISEAQRTSAKCDDAARNDNDDWPLKKLLLTEKNEYCLGLAARYRDVYDKATMPTDLIGREPDGLYEVRNRDADGRDKGAKELTGKRQDVSIEPKKAKATSDDTKQRAAPVPKKWQGDIPLVNAIDARRELAMLRARLAYVPKILEAFEMAVIDNFTLAEIGNALGAGSKGAKGEARARIFDGFEIVDRYWQRRRAA